MEWGKKVTPNYTYTIVISIRLLVYRRDVASIGLRGLLLSGMANTVSSKFARLSPPLLLKNTSLKSKKALFVCYKRLLLRNSVENVELLVIAVNFDLSH